MRQHGRQLVYVICRMDTNLVNVFKLGGTL